MILVIDWSYQFTLLGIYFLQCIPKSYSETQSPFALNLPDRRQDEGKEEQIHTYCMYMKNMSCEVLRLVAFVSIWRKIL